MQKIFWKIEDTRVSSSHTFDVNYFASEKDRKLARETMLRQLDSLEQATADIEKFRSERNTAAEALHDMNEKAADIIETYTMEIYPRFRPKYAGVKVNEAALLKDYVRRRNEAARMLDIPEDK